MRTVRVAGLAGASAAAVAAAALADPTVRAEIHRLRRFSRPLDTFAAGPPVSPPLPPGGTVAVPGVGEMFVRDSDPGGGRGVPAVVLLHGWGATADVNFFNAYGPLADDYRVLAFDLRGHGRGLRSDETFQLEACADDAAALLAALGVERAVAVGYSMGGPVALLLARRHHSHVAGLVLEATALEFHDGVQERLLWRGLTVVEALLRHGTGDGVVQRVLREAVDKEPTLDEYRAWLAGEFRRGYVRGIVDAGRALSRYDARPFAARLGLPAAVVLTTQDRLVPPRKQRMLAATLQATVFELAGDHDVPITAGPAFGRVTRAAVDDVARRGGLYRMTPVPAAAVAPRLSATA